MDIKEFTTYLISGIVKNPDMVRVSVFEGDEESTIVEVLVAESDMGAVIGKEGKNAKALRTIILAHAYLHDMKKVKINIDAC